MNSKRYVVDSNVLISAALSPKGKSRTVLTHIIAESCLIFCEETFAELATRLMRPKFDKWVSAESRYAFLEELAEFADWVDIESQTMGCRDKEDDKFLEKALIGQADAIITGDKDLLVMHPFEGIPIVSPNDWLETEKPASN